MTSLRRSGCVEIWLALAVFWIGTAVSNSVAGKSPPANQPGSTQPGSDDPSSPNYRLPGNEHKATADRDKLVAAIKEKLDSFKPIRAKKADDDLFVVGTIDLQNHHAVVDFPIKKGVQETADFIADFVLGKVQGEIRIWEVFGRAKEMKLAEGLQKKAKAESIESRLDAFRLSTSGKKSSDDYFVVGTADLDTSTLNADIRFEILNGVKAAADFIIDFIYNQPQYHQGEWHVFFRGHTETQAIAYRQKMRDLYDSMEAERARLAAIYNAKSTVRC